VGGWEKFQKQKEKKKPGAGQGENKVAKKPEIRPEKGQTQKVNLG
jgi:hypothetical protein